jgi:hypothetical protein
LDENKTDDPRSWTLNPGVAAALSEWKARYFPKARGTQLVFVQPNGRPSPGQIVWINEKAKEAGFLVADAFANLDRFKTFSFGNLTLVVPSLLHMTAMKLAALRTQTDRDDVVVLLKQLRARGMDRNAVLAHVGGLMPVAKQESARYDLEDLWEFIDESA